MSPLGAIILIVLIVIVFSQPRRWALLGMMAGVLYLTQGQGLELAGFNVFAMRILEVVGFTRVMSRQEFSFANLNKVDRTFLWLYGFATVVFLLRSPDGLAYQIGVAVDAFLCYFTFRGLVSDLEDCRWFLNTLAILMIPFVVVVAIERVTQHNLFSVMGGVPAYTWIRDDKVRCFGSFRHPSLLGTLGAVFLPLYIALMMTPAARKRALLGAGLCAVIVWASNSGGPLSAAAAAIVGWAFWRFRQRMRLVRRCMLGLVIVLAIFMKAPIWYLPARLTSLTGGDGWHRSYLMDVSMQHLNLWWLCGIPIQNTSDWFPYMLGTTGGSDITNEYIMQGLTAGIVAIGLFIFLLAKAYAQLGEAMAKVRAQADANPEAEYLLWGLGVVLTVHVVNWFGITYFDQTYAIWFMQLAMISTLSEKILQQDTAPDLSRKTEAEEDSAIREDAENPVGFESQLKHELV